MKHDDRLIVALDFPTLEQAKACVLELGDSVSYYKVGMELYYAVGSEIIRFLKDNGKHAFPGSEAPRYPQYRSSRTDCTQRFRR